MPGGDGTGPLGIGGCRMGRGFGMGAARGSRSFLGFGRGLGWSKGGTSKDETLRVLKEESARREFELQEIQGRIKDLES